MKKNEKRNIILCGVTSVLIALRIGLLSFAGYNLYTINKIVGGLFDLLLFILGISIIGVYEKAKGNNYTDWDSEYNDTIPRGTFSKMELRMFRVFFVVLQFSITLGFLTAYGGWLSR